MWTQLRASPGKGQDVYCTAISSTHKAYVEFFGLRRSRSPRPPHMPSGDSLRAWLAVPLSPSFRSFVGHEFTVCPGLAGRLHVFLRHPWLLLHFPFSLGNGGFFPRVSWPMPGSPPAERKHHESPTDSINGDCSQLTPLRLPEHKNPCGRKPTALPSNARSAFDRPGPSSAIRVLRLRVDPHNSSHRRPPRA